MSTEKPLNILLVEDNPGDIRLLKEFFKEYRIEHQLQVKFDGDEAITYLSEIKSDTNRPNLIFLDINLPKKSGFEVLDYIILDEDLSKIPAVFLSSSNDPYDRSQSIKRGAKAYVEKPLDLMEFFNIIHNIENCKINITFKT
ncbi:MAG TPA: response regulator [Bacteroidales bacterium]|nr:response regulator [Bacteroidales bacterium]HPE56414.1 response regulator [Bacteroidales bacterium]HRX97111.1 response regulator [Bacteroidales bacterium]